jgi:predicted TIM-barrel fold metal-dependent hydrolase
MAEARAFLDHIPVSAADRESIAHGNAERLFNL